MAHQFIEQNNQNLLWKIINCTPQIVSFFGNAAPGDKERWFKQVIKHVYDDNVSNRQGTSLRDLNKIAIDLMVELIKKAQAQAQAQAQVQAQVNPISSAPPSMETQFEMRRKEYENMTKKTVPTPSFTESIKDEAISDIGSAVNDYMKQRNMDVKMFSPPPPKGSEHVAIEIEEIDSNFSAKKVSWGNNVEHHYKENTESSIASLTETIATLSKKIDAQNELLNSILEKLSNNEKHINN